MIEELIQKTNEPEFYHNYDLLLVSSKSEIDRTNANVFEFNFVIEELNEEDSPKPINYWKIIAYNVTDSRGLFTTILLPYMKMKLLDDHPLLLAYKEDCYECELKGFPQKPNEFVGDLLFGFESLTGNWLNLNDYFQISEKYKIKGTATIFIPKFLIKLFEKNCLKHNIDFIIGDIEKTYQSNAKILLFGNEDVCSNDFDLHQPYIIAENFIAIKSE